MQGMRRLEQADRQSFSPHGGRLTARPTSSVHQPSTCSTRRNGQHRCPVRAAAAASNPPLALHDLQSTVSAIWQRLPGCASSIPAPASTPAHATINTKVGSKARASAPSSHVLPVSAVTAVSLNVADIATFSFSPKLQPDEPPPPSSAPGGGGSEGSRRVKKLIMLRHADSEDGGLMRDHDRPISQQGRAEAFQTARQLKALGWIPDLILGSNSLRTKQTINEVSQVIPELKDVDGHFYGSLYTVAALDGQTQQHLMECLAEVVSDGNSCVLLCGHNRGWEEAASAFAGQAVKLRTASAALLQTVAKSWGEALTEETSWQLVQVVQPGTP